MIAFTNELLLQDKIENHEEALAAETASLTLVEPGEAAVDHSERRHYCSPCSFPLGNRDEEVRMSSTSAGGLPAGPTTNRGRIRLVVFRVLAALAGLFFLVAVVLGVPAPWVLLQPEDPKSAGEPLVPHRGRQC